MRMLQVNEALGADGDMVMTFKVDAEGTLIPLHCHVALDNVSSFMTTTIVASSVKEIFRRTLGPRAKPKDRSGIKDVVWQSFSE